MREALALAIALAVPIGCASDEVERLDAAAIGDAPAERTADAPVDRVADETGTDTPETCESLIRAYTEIVNRADRSCTVDSDCRIEGDSNRSCDPRGLSIWCGVAVNDRAFPAADVDRLKQAAYRLGCRSGAYDCGLSEPACVGGRCTEKYVSGCLPGPEPARDGG